MLPALIRFVRNRWSMVILHLSRLWGHVFHLFSATAITTKNADAGETSPGVVEQAPGTLERVAQGFPSATEDEREEARKSFIESINLDAVCALASKFCDGRSCRVVSKQSGSFNVCFFIAFAHEEPEWVVRIPIEPALNDPWIKLLSEVSTIRYLKKETTIPVPHVHAYGRDADLTKTGAGTQAYLITDFIPGRPLDRRLLDEASEESRRNFYSGLIDIFTELRRLEFPVIGSLMPNPNGTPDPVLGPVISMSADTLRLPPPRQTFSSANEYMALQFRLISAFFAQPVSDLTVDDIREEVFALSGLETVFQQMIDPRLDTGPFVLNHMDLRRANIIVDESLRIQGIIDWEFTSTVPRQVFTPPSWITGHDPDKTNKHLHAEFRDLLYEKSRDNAACDQLRTEWYGQFDANKLGNVVQTDTAFYIAHMIRRPTDATDIFYESFFDCPNKDAAISEFFDNHPSLALEAQHRAEQCERYSQFLKTNGLYEDKVDRLLAEAKEFGKKWGWTSNQ